MQHQDLSREKLLQTEWENLQDEGCIDLVLLRDIQQAIHTDLSVEEYEKLWSRIDEVNAILMKDANEPSDLPAILERRHQYIQIPELSTAPDKITDKVHGAWLARCAGCTLGKPVEGWAREKIRRYLQAANAYPLHTYIPAMSEFPAGLELWENYTGTTLGNIRRMVRDDDTDYTVMGLKVLEKHGRNFETRDIGKLWLANLPFGSIFTAEAIAYRNLVNEMEPPQTASYRNPYREFIGAQIRGDMWGYVNPGDPEAAAAMAFRDASLSHTKNGIYGEMWAAACIAAAFTLDDPREIILAGLSQIPADCRLTKAVLKTMEWADIAASWEEVRDNIEKEFADMSSIHVINNTCLIVMGLLFGNGDMGETLCITLMGGLDTDCTCATAGSMIGAIKGAQHLSPEWVNPLKDELQSMINGYELCKISELAEKTCVLINI